MELNYKDITGVIIFSSLALFAYKVATYDPAAQQAQLQNVHNCLQMHGFFGGCEKLPGFARYQNEFLIRR